MSANYRNIGRLVAVFGLQGELVLQHRLGKKTSLKGLKTLFLEDKKDEMLPWFIEGARAKSEDEVILKLEGLDSKEAARKVVQKEVWLAEKDFEAFAGRQAPISLVGFLLMQVDAGPGKGKSAEASAQPLGEILEVIEQPHQVLCKIELEGKEALIPIHGETLRKIDQQKREVYVELPDGLLDIYR